MKNFIHLSVVLVTMTIAGCHSMNDMNQTAQNIVKREKIEVVDKQHTYEPTNPLAVQIYAEDHPLSQPYNKIAIAKVSKFNLVGIKRQEATVRDLMRDLAASVGGTAAIEITQDEKYVSAVVIREVENA